LEREQEWKSKANCVRRLEKCVGRGVDQLFLRSLDWLQIFSVAPVTNQVVGIGIRKLSFEEVTKQG
jgi:hypothetical protein